MTPPPVAEMAGTRTTKRPRHKPNQPPHHGSEYQL